MLVLLFNEAAVNCVLRKQSAPGEWAHHVSNLILIYLIPYLRGIRHGCIIILPK